MPTYSAAAVSDTVIAHKQGITIQQGRALRDNPIAMAEGQPDAPLIQGHALQNLFIGFAHFGASDFSNAFTNATRIAKLYVNAELSTTAASIQFSTDGGSTWGTEQFLGPSLTFSPASKGVVIDLVAGTTEMIVVLSPSATLETSTITVPSGINAFRFRRLAGPVFTIEGRG